MAYYHEAVLLGLARTLHSRYCMTNHFIYSVLASSYWVQQKRARIRKTTLMKELGKCVIAAQTVQLDSLGIGIQDVVQLRHCNSQEDFLTALGVRSRDFSHTLRKPPLAGVAVVVPAIR